MHSLSRYSDCSASEFMQNGPISSSYANSISTILAARANGLTVAVYSCFQGMEICGSMLLIPETWITDNQDEGITQ